MAKQFWVSDFYVDLSRNQISKHDQPQNLAPKALMVLSHLAENHGKVVSYDELLDKVWPNSVVTPNTLQRCIAQLRKALGESSKAQSMIKTHAKQGYSLECEVTWSEQRQSGVAVNTHNTTEERLGEELNVATDTGVKDSHQPEYKLHVSSDKNASIKYVWMGAVVVLILVIFFSQYHKGTPQLQFSELRYLTATDDKEYGGKYSSDGEYILFRRYFDKACINNIWAKNTSTLEEVQLTKQRGTYGGFSHSADGETLIFIKEEDCSKPITQNTCYKLMSLNFNQALLQPQTAQEILHCQNSAIKKPVWIDNQQIAMMQKEDLHWRLIRYSLQNKSSSNLYEIEGGNIISYAYSAEHNLFAVTSIKNDGLQYIEMLSPDGEVKSSHQIQFPGNTPRHLRVYPNFVPNTETLIFGDGSDLYSLSYDGEVNRENFQLADNIGGPSFHPDGNRMLLIKGSYDSDMATLSIPIQASNQNEQQEIHVPLTVFERSIERDDLARFQPNGSHIAFVSGRTGSQQVWLFGDGGKRVISQFPKGSFIENLHWDLAGDSLLVIANQELHHLFLHASPVSINFRYPVTNLFHWDSDKQLVIANILVNGISKFVEIDLDTLQYKLINSKRVNWAVKRQNGPLIFMDHMNRFWQKGMVEDKLIEPLVGQGSSKQFVLENERMYGINKSNQLWSYNLQSGAFNILADVTAGIDSLTDVNDNELLVSVFIAGKKEVIELSVAH